MATDKSTATKSYPGNKRQARERRQVERQRQRLISVSTRVSTGQRLTMICKMPMRAAFAARPRF